MRQLTLIILAAGIAAAPAAAQQTGETTAVDPLATNNADPSLSAGAVDTSAGATAPMNGLAPGPTATTATIPPTAEAPGVTDATVTPETNEGPGFPWGLLGLLGLAGLIGRFRR